MFAAKKSEDFDFDFDFEKQAQIFDYYISVRGSTDINI